MSILWSRVELLTSDVSAQSIYGLSWLPASSFTFNGGSWRAGQNHHSLAVGEILWVVFLTEDLDEGARLLFVGRGLHGSSPEQITEGESKKKRGANNSFSFCFDWLTVESLQQLQRALDQSSIATYFVRYIAVIVDKSHKKTQTDSASSFPGWGE